MNYRTYRHKVIDSDEVDVNVSTKTDPGQCQPQILATHSNQMRKGKHQGRVMIKKFTR